MACVASCFFSAVLMFALEPMLARLLLPTYGGSPAVWNTAVVVYQVLLVLGYLYAHRLHLGASPGRQALVHGGLVLGSLVFVPPTIRQLALGPEQPVAGIAVALLASAGLPFFVLATNATLTQQWFARGEARDPAWLYAASNAGSLAALAGYPFLFDRAFGLSDQSRIWGYCYAAFAVLTLSIVVTSAWLARGNDAERPASAGGPRETVPWQRQAGWLARTAVASSLLLSVTLRISADAGAGPMFWTIPLALYLATFVLAFSRDGWIPRRFLAVSVVLTTVGCLSTYLYPWPLAVRIALNLALLFFGSLLCHADVARDRPRTSELPRYFLVIAIGGMVGGLLNSVAAPALFNTVAEYPLTLVALSLCIPVSGELSKVLASEHWRRRESYVVPVTMLLAAVAALVAVQHHRASATAEPAYVFILGAVLGLGVVFLREPAAFQLGVVTVTAFVLLGLTEPNRVVRSARSFFSTLKVVDTSEYRSFVHGGVLHGLEYKDPKRKLEFPYHDRRGPLARTMQLFPGKAEIGVVGLGAGALAAMAEREHHLTFYEIDPLVYELASTEFSFLRESKAKLDHVMGDARLTLARAPAGHFDLLFLDAFSGDGVPMHLLTREAIESYLQKLKPDGLLVFHISNNYVDLSRVLRGFGRASGMKVLVASYRPPLAERERGAVSVDAVAISRSEETLRRLDAVEQWRPLSLEGRHVLWTDDRHDIIGVMDWSRLRLGG
jgi:spermidine synthase